MPATGELTTITLPDLSRHSVRAPFDPVDFTWHTHAAGLWCHFVDQVRSGIDAQSGDVVWKHVESEGGYHSFMAHVVDDRIYCGDKAISCYEGATGALVWRQPVGGGYLCSRLCHFGDVIWATSRSGEVLRVRLRCIEFD